MRRRTLACAGALQAGGFDPSHGPSAGRNSTSDVSAEPEVFLLVSHTARLASLLLVCRLAMPGAVAEEPSKAEKIAVKATDWGKVWGQVYDAETELPIEGAQVVVQEADQADQE